MSARTIHAAVLASLESLPFKTFDGHVPEGPDGRPNEQRYAVLWGSPGRLGSSDLAGTVDESAVDFRVTSTGITAEQSLDVATAVIRRLVGARLDVTGLSCGPVTHVSDAPVRRYDDLPGDAPLFYCSDVFSVLAASA